MDREAPRCRAKLIVLVDLIRESKAKEEREEEGRRPLYIQEASTCPLGAGYVIPEAISHVMKA